MVLKGLKKLFIVDSVCFFFTSSFPPQSTFVPASGYRGFTFFFDHFFFSSTKHTIEA